MVEGTKVKHKHHGFEGVIIAESTMHNNVVVLITKGEHPYSHNKATYTAGLENLEIIHNVESVFESVVKELLEDAIETGDYVDININGNVKVKMNDGSEIKFEYYADFIDFIKSQAK